MNAPKVMDNTVRHLVPAALFSVVTAIAFGLVFPAVVWGLSTVLFHDQAEGSLVDRGGTVIGSRLVGQNFAAPKYFHPRPSAAGSKGYDPTATGGTNLGPTSKKWYDATKATIAAVRKENPDATGPVPADLVTSSASGIDPDISPAGAAYQIARVAKARGMTTDAVAAIVDRDTTHRTLGFLGEPYVDVLRVNMDLDAGR